MGVVARGIDWKSLKLTETADSKFLPLAEQDCFLD